MHWVEDYTSVLEAAGISAMGGINEYSTNLTVGWASPPELSCWLDHEPCMEQSTSLDVLSAHFTGMAFLLLIDGEAGGVPARFPSRAEVIYCSWPRHRV